MGIFSAASVELTAMAKSLRICIHSSLRSVQARSSKPKESGPSFTTSACGAESPVTSG